MRKLKQSYVLVVIVVLLLPFTLLLYFRYSYPFGVRPAYLQVVMQALRAYAADHNGDFPSEGKTPQDALQQLYPQYLSAEYLAGISGSRSAVKSILENGGKLGDARSSWVYHPGLHIDDDCRIALIWESKDGIIYNGSRMDGVKVAGFINGEIRIILASEWPSFEKEQTILRKKANDRHNSMNPTHP